MLAQNSVYHARMKHIDIRYHRIRELVEEGEVELVKVHTSRNPADALTKILPQDGFYKYVELMGLLDRKKLAEAMKHQGEDCRIWCGTPKPQRNKKASKKEEAKEMTAVKA